LPISYAVALKNRTSGQISSNSGASVVGALILFAVAALTIGLEDAPFTT
jgi:hypothetical protein